ncbi:MAG: sialate O-acetylesterase [Marinilabilia sp.]
MNYTYTKLRVLLIFSAVFLSTGHISGEVKLPQLIGEGMVLQRDTEIRIWGWASPGETVSVDFRDDSYQTETGEDGKWEILLPEMKAGGPWSMTVEGENRIEISNILIGDVWICSGQSNMELPVQRVHWIYEDEFRDSKNEQIRQFKVPQTYDFKKRLKDYESGEWVSLDENTVMNFSAVGYFFARDLYDRYGVPVGLINTAIGGSPAEAWMSEEALKAFPEHYEEMQRMKDDSLIQSIQESDQERNNKWYQELGQKEKAYNEAEKPWHHPDVDHSSWKSIQVPGYWDEEGIEPFNGSVWYRKTIDLDAGQADQSAKLLLGRIVDADSVFVNGEFVGNVTYEYPPRRYDVPGDLLQEGENTIAVRVINSGGVGGFVPDKPYRLDFEQSSVDLTGEWKYRIGAEMDALAGQTFIRWKPGGLFNAMIAPLLNYKSKGVIWYQGESNTDRAEEYQELFPAMIKDWRASWSQNELPFLFVQLANFMEPPKEPQESNWAMLREAQTKALELPNTGMAVAIDVGEWNDIHPLNKESVGSRLALTARKVAYNEDVVASGPVFESMKIEGNKAILSFKHIGGGLKCEGEKLQEFAIAGEDKEFVWAKAKIKGDKVIVWSDEVENPVAVRYAWADNPDDANLYNEEGLPAVPFRTVTSRDAQSCVSTN